MPENLLHAACVNEKLETGQLVDVAHAETEMYHFLEEPQNGDSDGGSRVCRPVVDGQQKSPAGKRGLVGEGRGGQGTSASTMFDGLLSVLPLTAVLAYWYSYAATAVNSQNSESAYSNVQIPTP